MEIKQYNLEDKAQFEKFADLFEMQKTRRILKPSIFKYRPCFSRANETFLVAQNPTNQHILGILNYSVIFPTQDGKLREDVSIFPFLERRFEYGFHGNFAWIHFIESFNPRQGIGTKLVSEIKSNSNFSGIYSIPAYVAREFYSKNDFVRVEHLCNKQGVLAMLWKRDGLYL
ncbi:MAG: hypothetical protein WC402_01775 [Candidatus Pacearchaeota archaeon]|jgi:hypothetical protein